MKNKPFQVRSKLSLKTLIFCLWTCSLGLFAFKGSTQSIDDVSISLYVKDATVEHVLQTIEQKTPFTFVYQENLISGISEKVTISAKQSSVTKVLDRVSNITNLSFKQINENTIGINRESVTRSVTTARENIKSLVQVKGTVTDENGETLPGANVRIKGTSKGTITGGDGKYTLSVPSASSVLVFSFVGFTTQEIEVGNQSQIDVSLLPDTKKLDEVVFEGFREIKANEFAGSAITITKDDLRVASETTVDKMLQGQMAGVTVENTSSVFGVAPKIRIRGSSSITGINKPLWVLDGVVLESPLNVTSSELESAGIRTVLASELGGLNPNDINTITVLKDASATALYGTRAVNGVIVVTTKRGKVNQQLGISYNGLTTVSLKHSIREFDVLNSKEQIEFHEKIYNVYTDEIHERGIRVQGPFAKLVQQRNRRFITESEFDEGVRRLKTQNTDWFDYLFRNSVTTQHNIGVSYGGEKNAGRSSFSYYNDNGYSIGQKVQRYTISTTNKYFINDKISMESLIKYATREQRNPGTRVNPFIYAKNASRAMRPYNDFGKFEYYKLNMVDYNIIEEVNNDYAEIESEEASMQINLTYSPLKNLTFTALGSTKRIFSKITEIQTELSNYARSYRTQDERGSATQRNPKLFRVISRDDDRRTTVLPKGGFLVENTIITRSSTARLQGDWKILDSNSHQLKLFAGTEITTLRTKETHTNGVGYIFSIGTPFPRALYFKFLEQRGHSYYSTRNFNRNAISYYGSINYIHKNKYIITFSSRYDGNNIASTGEKEKFLPTWVVSGAWKISEEAFMQGIEDKISNIKLRASYGLRGNSANRGPDLIASFKRRVNQLMIEVQEPENQDLEWEKEYIFSSGIEFTLFDKVNVIAEYYHRKNFDLIGYKFVPLSSGYNIKLLNWATMVNEGVELTFRLNPIEITEELNWSGSINIGFNKNRIVSDYIGNNPSIRTITKESGFPAQGKPLTGLYSIKFAGLDRTGLPQYYNGKNEKVALVPLRKNDRQFIEYQGSRDPLYAGGFNSEFRYKGFRLSTVLTFNLGHVVRKLDYYRASDYLTSTFADELNRVSDYKNRWVAPGDENYTSIPRLMDRYDQAEILRKQGNMKDFYTTYNRTNIRTVNASFVRLKSILFGYEVPQRISSKLRLRKLSANIQLSNIYVFASKKLKGQDPETLFNGINIPPIRTITFGLNIDI